MSTTVNEAIEPKMVTKEVAAKMYSINPRTIQRLAHPNGPLPCIRLGSGGKRRLIRFFVTDLETFFNSQRQGMPGDANNPR